MTGTSGRAAGPVLEVHGLQVDYGQGPGAVHAVAGVDLAVKRGQVFGLAGESGSGKSTLAYAIARLIRPPGRTVGGEVTYRPVDGPPVDVLRMDAKALRQWRWERLAVVPQASMNALNPVTPLAAQLTDVLRVHRPTMSRRERVERAASVLDLVGISRDRMNAYAHQLSGGMRQRAMIAMAVILEPEILIMDEPTTALDVVVQKEILAQLVELANRLSLSVVFITHDLSLLLEIADSIAVMYAGRIVEQGAAGRLKDHALHPYTQGLLNSFPSLIGPKRPLSGIPGAPPDPTALPSGCAFHPRCPIAADPCQRDVPAIVDHGGQRVACFAQETQEWPPPADPEDGIRTSGDESRMGVARS